MSDAEYLEIRAAEELTAAFSTSDSRVRLKHLELADAYSSRLREAKAVQARGQMKLVGAD